MFDPTHLMTQPATLRYRTIDESASTDDYGNPQAVETTADALVHLQPTTRISEAGETTGLATVEEETFSAFMPPDTGLDGLDAITVDGLTYELTGPAARWFHPVRRLYLYAVAVVRRTA